MKFSTLLLFPLVLYINVYSQASVRNTIITGSLVNYQNILPIDINSELEPLANYPSNLLIIPDSTGTFKATLNITEDNYYKIGRNVVFLGPNKKLDVVINYYWPDSSRFSGDLNHENNYLKFTPFPYGGSFLEGGDRIYPTLLETIDSVLYSAKKRKNQLDKLLHVSREFKVLEDTRIKADIINSLKYLSFYFCEKNKITGDSAIEISTLCNKYIKDYISKNEKSLYKSMFLNLEVYRLILPFLLNYGKFPKSEGDKVNAWLYATQVARKLKSIESRDQISRLNKSVDSISIERYRLEISRSFEYISSFNGEPAFDFEIKSPTDSIFKLSSFKGKLILIDVWATWCGPCIEQLPKWRKLVDSYKSNNEIIILTISIDGEIEKWKRFIASDKSTLNHYISDRLMLEPYKINVLPRTIVIDKNFKISALRGPDIMDSNFQELLKEMMDKN